MKPNHMSRKLKSREVDAMTTHHEMEFDDACYVVSLEPNQYISGCEPLGWIPTPECISQQTTAMKIREDFYDIDRTQPAP